MTPTNKSASPPLADEKALSEWLVERLPLDDMPAELWLSLTRSGHVERALDPVYTTGLDECLATAGKWLGRNPRFKTAARHRAIPGTPPTLEKLLGSEIRERAKLQSEMVLAVLRQSPEVVKLRQTLLASRTLTREEAGNLILSDAAALLDAREFTSEGIPIVGHTAQLCGESGGPTGLLTPTGYFRVEWSGRQIDLPLKEEWIRRDSLYEPTLAYPAPDLTLQRRSVRHSSVLDDIGTAARAIAPRVLWHEHEATWFILTDMPLYDPPLHGSIRARRATGITLGQIVLEIDAWVPASRVSEVYKAVQREEFKAGHKSSGSRKLKLYRFATAWRAESPSRVFDEVARKKWNQGPKGQKRYSSLKMFRRDIRRAFDWVDREMISPRYGLLAKAESRSAPKQRARRKHGAGTPE